MQQEPAADHHPWMSRSSVSPSFLRFQPQLDQAADGFGATGLLASRFLTRRLTRRVFLWKPAKLV